MKRLSLITLFVWTAIYGYSQQTDSTTQSVLTLKQQKKAWKRGVPEKTMGFTFAFYSLVLEPKFTTPFSESPRAFGVNLSLARNYTNYFSPKNAIFLRMNWFRFGTLSVAGYLALYAGLPSPGIGFLHKTYKKGSVQFGANVVHGIVKAGFEPVHYSVSYLVDSRLTFDAFSLGLEGYVIPGYAKNINGKIERVGLERYIGLVIGVAF
ncbi:MAG: hypothetical protein KJ941_11385 [Bacteroidetes bacterium]|nr:hypothetical protein [Bacteroidota bacterium]